MANLSINPSSDEQPIGSIDKEHVFRVLVVEDSFVQQKMLANVLRQLGYSVGTANNGLEAISAILLAPYDIILMDCQLPLMDGLEATKSIRDKEHKNRQQHRIIIGISSSASSEECLKAGMNDFLPKPLTRTVLMATLGRWIKSATA